MKKRMWKVSLAVIAMGMAVPLIMGGCKGVLDEEANAVLRDRLGETSFTVFPAFVRGGPADHYTAEEAARIGEFLSAEKLGAVTQSDAEVPITGPWHMDESRMLRESIASFQAYLADHPIDTEYALLAEYLILGKGGIGGIHCYLLDKEGRVAEIVMLNSHHKPFYEADPKTVQDCTDILIGVLRDYLVKAGGAQDE